MQHQLPTPPNSPIPPCSEIRRQLRDLRVESEPKLPQHKWIFPQDRIRRLFTDRNVRSLLGCHCSRCSNQRHVQQITDPAPYVFRVLGDYSNTRHGRSTWVILLALLVFIECPALIYTFIRKDCEDQLFIAQTAIFTSEHVRKTFWHQFSSSDVEEYADKFHWARYQFAIPHMNDDPYEEYPSSVILPFVNERRLGKIAATGEIISEGHFGDVYAFDILDEYCHFTVSFL